MQDMGHYIRQGYIEQCEHPDRAEAAHAGIRVSGCSRCSTVMFADADGDVPPSVAISALFGEFDLVGSLDTVGAPGCEVLMYRAPNLLVRAGLRVLSTHQWFRADADLWLSHDGEHLLFAHDHPLVSDLVGA